MTTYPLARIPREHWNHLLGGRLVDQDGAVLRPLKCSRSPQDEALDWTLRCLDVDAGGLRRVDVQTNTLLLDLADPATRGCVLEVLRAVTGDPSVSLMVRDQVDVMTWSPATSQRSGYYAQWCLSPGSTEAETLVAALEQALEVQS